MSHVATIKIEVKDLEALKAACKEIGLQFNENQKTYKWYGQHVGDYCFDDKTQVMTVNGLKLFSQLCPGELVMTFNHSSGMIEYEPASIVQNKYVGKMLSFNAKAVCQIVTPNHRMYVRRKESRTDRNETVYKFIEADKLASIKNFYNYTVFRGGNWEGINSEYVVVCPAMSEMENYSIYDNVMQLTASGVSRNEVSRITGKNVMHIGKWIRGESEPHGSNVCDRYDVGDFVELVGWFIAEGHLTKAHNYRVCITQLKSANPEKFDRINNLLSRLGFNQTIMSDDVGFVIYSKRLYEYFMRCGLYVGAKDKFIPDELKNMSPDILERMIESLVLGDGSEERRFYTSSIRLRDDFIEIAQKCGYGCTFSLRNNKTNPDKYSPDKICPVWDVCFSKHTVNHRIKFIEEIDYDGMTYCVSTNNGIILVERNGKLSWSGNSLPNGYKASDLGHCDHAISVPGKSDAYEIGVVKRKDGKEGYDLLWDFWSGGYGLEKAVGKDCEKLVGAYAKHVARQQVTTMAKRQGWSYAEEFNEQTGETVFTLRRY